MPAMHTFAYTIRVCVQNKAQKVRCKKIVKNQLWAFFYVDFLPLALLRRQPRCPPFLRFFGGRSVVWERLLLLLFSGLFPPAVAAFLLSRHCVVFAGICYIFFFLAMGVCRQAAGLGRHWAGRRGNGGRERERRTAVRRTETAREGASERAREAQM